MPHRGLALDGTDAALLAACEGCTLAANTARFSPGLLGWLAQAASAWPEGMFLRLGGRSFVTPERPAAAVRNAAQALQVLASPGDRAARMAHRCQLAGRPVWLFARQWRSMPPEQEFRLVIRQRRLVAASQLHPGLVATGLLSEADLLARRLALFCQQLAPALHLADVVADVWLPRSAHPSAELVELNPLMRATGRALLADAVAGPHPHALHLRADDGSVLRVPLPER